MKRFTAFTESEIDVHGIVEATLTIIDNNDENETATTTQQHIGEPEQEPDERELDLQINCDLVLKDYDKISPTHPNELIECKSQSHHHIHPYSLQSDFTFSSLYHLSDFTDCDLEKSKQPKTSSSKINTMFKPDELGINRSDNYVFKDDEIPDFEKNDWWISPMYYDNDNNDNHNDSYKNEIVHETTSKPRCTEPCMLL